MDRISCQLFHDIPLCLTLCQPTHKEGGVALLELLVGIGAKLLEQGTVAGEAPQPAVMRMLCSDSTVSALCACGWSSECLGCVWWAW